MDFQLIDYGKIGASILHNLPLILGLLVMVVALAFVVATIEAVMTWLAPILGASAVVYLIVVAIGPQKVLYGLGIGIGGALAIFALYQAINKIRDLMPAKVRKEDE